MLTTVGHFIIYYIDCPLTDLSTVFTSIGVYEPQKTASTAFTDFGAAHKLV